MIYRASSIFYSVFAFFIWADGAIQPEVVQAEEVVSDKEARFVVASIFNRPLAIEDAHVEISSLSSGRGEVKYVVYCDFVKNRFRVDHHSERDVRKTVKRPEWIMIYPEGSGVATRYPPDFDIPWSDSALIDLRAIGLRDCGSIVNYELQDIEQLFSTHPKRVKVRKIDGGLYSVCLDTPVIDEPGRKVEARFEIRCSEPDDFAVTEASLTMGENGDFKVTKPHFSVNTDYGKQGEILLPIKCFSILRPPNKEYSTDWTIKWLAVNEGIDERVFTADGLGLKPRTIVSDARRGEPVIERIVDGSGEKILSGARPRRSFWIIGSIGLLIFLSVLYVWKSRSGE